MLVSPSSVLLRPCSPASTAAFVSLHLSLRHQARQTRGGSSSYAISQACQRHCTLAMRYYSACLGEVSSEAAAIGCVPVYSVP